MYNLKIACLSTKDPRLDYIFHLQIEDDSQADSVIADINSNIRDCYLELISIEPENTRS